MIKAIVFDLDDTLIPEIEYVKSGFSAIAEHFNDEPLADRLYELFCENKKNVYQRAGLNDVKCSEAIEVYRKHKPKFKLENDIVELFNHLKSNGYKLGVITDGRPEGQRNKIEALELDKWMDCIVVTDELGGELFRKPHPKSFEIMREKLGVEFAEMMYVGDNPKKDFYIGSIYPICTVRLVSSEGIYNDDEYFKGIKERFRITDVRKLFNYI